MIADFQRSGKILEEKEVFTMSVTTEPTLFMMSFNIKLLILSMPKDVLLRLLVVLIISDSSAATKSNL